MESCYAALDMRIIELRKPRGATRLSQTSKTPNAMKLTQETYLRIQIFKTKPSLHLKFLLEN